MDFLKGLKEVSSAASKLGFAVACVAPVVTQIVGNKEAQVITVVTPPPPASPPKRCSMFTPPQVCEDRNCRYHQTSTERNFSKLR